MFLSLVRAHLEHVWTVVVLAASVSFLVVAAETNPHRMGDGVGSVIALYGEAAASVPVDELIGFLAAPRDSPDAAVFYLAQYGLAPRLLTQDISTARIVVSSPAATAAFDRDPRLTGFHLHAVHRGGIRIYVRGVR